jgi:hypothetical protein
MKKRISMAIAVATAAATMASVSVPVMADDVNITIFNSKMEVQSQFRCYWCLCTAGMRRSGNQGSGATEDRRF